MPTPFTEPSDFGLREMTLVALGGTAVGGTFRFVASLMRGEYALDMWWTVAEDYGLCLAWVTPLAFATVLSTNRSLVPRLLVLSLGGGGAAVLQCLFERGMVTWKLERPWITPWEELAWWACNKQVVGLIYLPWLLAFIACGLVLGRQSRFGLFTLMGALGASLGLLLREVYDCLRLIDVAWHTSGIVGSALGIEAVLRIERSLRATRRESDSCQEQGVPPASQ